MSVNGTGRRRFLISIHHPAQVHFYRHIVGELRSHGHEVRVCVRDKEMAAELLDAFDIEHTVLNRARETFLGTALTQGSYEIRLLREALRFRPDVLTSIGGIEISHVAPLVGARSIAFTDTPSSVARRLTSPFLDITCTPTAFNGSVRGEHRQYEGYHELAYLHPDRFDPQIDRLREYGVDPGEELFLVRFVSWQAYHDVGKAGFSRAAKQKLISTLDDEGTVYITSERPLPVDFEEYALPVPSHLVHDLLAATDLYVGDSATMATEAALLGVPTVRMSTDVTGTDIGNFIELEERYELLSSFADEARALDRVEELLDTPAVGEQWKQRRDRLLAEKRDVTAYAVEQLETLAGVSPDTRPVEDRTPLAEPQ